MTTCLDLRSFCVEPSRWGASLDDIEAALTLLDSSLSEVRGIVYFEDSEALISSRDAVALLHAGNASSRAHAGDCNRPVEVISEVLRDFTRERFSSSALSYQFDAWFVPAASDNYGLLRSWDEVAGQVSISALFCGAEPMFYPERYLPSAVTNWSPYFRWISQLESVVCTTDSALADLQTLADGMLKPGWVSLG